MKKSVLTAAVLAVVSSPLCASDSAEKSTEVGKMSGEIRSFYITRARAYGESSKDYTESSFAVGGNLGYEKRDYGIEGVSTAVRFYATEPVGEQPQKQSAARTGEERLNATLFKNGEGEGYALLGEAFVTYRAGNTDVTAGRQKLNTPLAGADDVRMLPTLFEAAVVANRDIPDTTLLAALVSKVAYGTFANATPGDANISKNLGSLHYGYGANKAVGTFQNMGDAAIGEDTDGVTALAAIYDNRELGLKLQVWDYIAADILTALYAQADYDVTVGPSHLFLAAQSLSQEGSGDRLAGKIHGEYSAVKAGIDMNGFSAMVAASQSGSDKNAALHGSIISPWGGAPAFTNGMVTRHGFISDVKAQKLQLGYKAGKVKATLASMTYDMGKENDKSFGHEWQARETTADVIYTMHKELMLRYRLNITDKNSDTDAPKSEAGWTEHRLIVSYKF